MNCVISKFLVLFLIASSWSGCKARNDATEVKAGPTVKGLGASEMAAADLAMKKVLNKLNNLQDKTDEIRSLLKTYSSQMNSEQFAQYSQTAVDRANKWDSNIDTAVYFYEMIRECTSSRLKATDLARMKASISAAHPGWSASWKSEIQTVVNSSTWKPIDHH